MQTYLGNWRIYSNLSEKNDLVYWILNLYCMCIIYYLLLFLFSINFIMRVFIPFQCTVQSSIRLKYVMVIKCIRIASKYFNPKYLEQ